MQTMAYNPHRGMHASNTEIFSLHDVTYQFLLAPCKIHTGTCAWFLGSETCCTQLLSTGVSLYAHMHTDVFGYSM
jgi:hypothetical protein